MWTSPIRHTHEIFRKYVRECVGRKSGTRHTCELDDLHNFTIGRSIFMDVTNKGQPMRFLNIDDLRGFGDKVVEFYIHKSINGIENGTLDWLTSVHTIRLVGNDLPVIEVGTFVNIPVVYLFLSGNNIRSIRPGAFAHLRKLEGIYLLSNHLKVIHSGVFAGLKAHDLDLSHNEIVHIEPTAFYSMSNLRNVYFNGNKLTDFYSELLFNTTKYLARVELEDNLLTRVGYEHFKNTPAVKHLNLNNNVIVDVHNNTFDSMASLKTIRLSGNRLTSLDFSPPGTLTHLYLERNHLSYISEGFLSKLVGLKAFGLYGNPWKCACYDFLLEWTRERKVKVVKADDGSFSNGKQPICVVSSDTSVCDDKIDEDAVKKYLKRVVY